MQSKVHPRYKKYRVANWPAYNQALVRRGDVTVWLSSEAVAVWTPRRSGRRGGQRRYSDLAIETALTLRLLYHLPLRQTEGFLHALFGMMRLDLSVPDSTTLSRRSQHLRRRLRLVPPGAGLHLVLDSTGLSIVGAGEWAAATHGGRGRRGWRKLHLGVDRSGVIRVHTLIEATGDDATTALDLLTAVEGPLVRVTADAAFDTVAVYETARARGATVVIPPAKTATVSGHGLRSPARDRTITLVRQLGRRRWKGVRVPSSGPGGECVLPIQVHHRRWPSRPELSRRQVVLDLSGLARLFGDARAMGEALVRAAAGRWLRVRGLAETHVVGQTAAELQAAERGSCARSGAWRPARGRWRGSGCGRRCGESWRKRVGTPAV